MKRKKGGAIALALAAAAAIGLGFAGKANASDPKGGRKPAKGKGKGKKPKPKPKPGSGRGGKLPGKGKGAGADVDPSKPRGIVWGDPGKIPADFDYQSNKIWISSDCTAVAVGAYFFAEGVRHENSTPWKLDLPRLQQDLPKGGPLLRYPDATDQIPDLMDVLEEDPKRTAYTWVGDYLESRFLIEVNTGEGDGGDVSPEDFPFRDALNLLIAQASIATGGSDCSRRRGEWGVGLQDFYNFCGERIAAFQEFIYQPVTGTLS